MADETTKVHVPAGDYDAKPTCCGLTETTTERKYPQFAIECAVFVPYTDESGEQKFRTELLTKFGGLEGEGLEYTLQDAENCGCDPNESDPRKWMIDPNRELRVKVAHEEYQGKIVVKLKSIFSKDRQGGFLIKKMAMSEERAAIVVADVSDRIAALRAARQGGGAQSRPLPTAPTRAAAPAAPTAPGTTNQPAPAAPGTPPIKNKTIPF